MFIFFFKSEKVTWLQAMDKQNMIVCVFGSFKEFVAIYFSHPFLAKEN
jgi:hypothetical protein